MAKSKAKKALEDLFSDLDETLDYDEYAQLARPHRWVEAQVIFAAARYLQRGVTE